MFKPVLLVGVSDQGPDGHPYQPETAEDAQEVFGWYTDQVETLTATASGVTLNSTIIPGSLEIYQVKNSHLFSNALYNPELDDTAGAVTFGSPGSSGTYLFRYVKTPDENSLILGLRSHLFTGGTMPWLYRVAGVRANIQLGDLLLRAKCSGTLFNSVTITTSGTTLTIGVPFSPSLPSTSYDISLPTGEVAEKINVDCNMGLHPVQVDIPSVDVLTLPTGTWSLTGGTNGSLNETSIVEVLNTLDIDDIGLIVLCGGVSSGTVGAGIGAIEGLSNGGSCIVAGSPESLRSQTNAQYQTYLTSLGFSSDRAFYCGGWGYVSLPYGYNVWTALPALFSGVWSKTSTSVIHKPTGALDINPIWTAAELSTLGSQFCVPTRFIQTDFGFFRAPTLSGINSLTTRVKLDITERLLPVLQPFIGEPSIELGVIKEVVGNALSDLLNVRELTYTCYVDMQTITVKINTRVYGEVNDIVFDVRTHG